MSGEEKEAKQEQNAQEEEDTGDKKDEWVEYKDQQNNTYWYNKTTKKTTWANPLVTKTAEKLENGGWVEYKNSDGTVYYFNSITNQTTWTKPKCLRKASTSKEKSDEQKKPKKERVKEFKEMLDVAAIRPEWEWDGVMKLLLNDPRYKLLKTVGERKAAYNEWREGKKKQKQVDALTEKKRNVMDFCQMLEQNIMLLSITTDTKFDEVEKRLSRDDRWDNLPVEERRTVFDEFIRDIKYREKMEERQQRRDAMISFHKLLKETTAITVHNCQWRKLQDKLAQHPAYAALTSLDRLIVFEDYVEDMKRRYEEEKMYREEANKRREKQAREKWLAFLAKKQHCGELTGTTTWKEFAGKPGDAHPTQQEAAYVEMSKYGLLFMQDLFDDFRNDIKKELKRKRKEEEREMGLLLPAGARPDTLLSKKRRMTGPSVMEVLFKKKDEGNKGTKDVHPPKTPEMKKKGVSNRNQDEGAKLLEEELKKKRQAILAELGLSSE